MKPTKVFQLLFFVFFILFTLSVLIPEEGLPIVGEWKLRFASLRSMLGNEEKPKPVDISAIVEANYVSPEAQSDSTKTQGESQPEVPGIILPDAFDNPFTAMHERFSGAENRGELIRVLHFGDSQIEADRITNILRESFQSQYGGCGVGLVPITESSHARTSVFLESAEAWERNEIYRSKSGSQERFGLSGYQFQIPDNGAAWMDIEQNPRYFATAKNFQRLSLYYSDIQSENEFILSSGKETLHSGSIPPADNFSSITWNVESDLFPELRLELNSMDSAKFYGFSLDCHSGIAVDNISWRGSSGLEFSKMNRGFLRQQLETQNPGLIIFQFGVNVVPYIIDDYSYYERGIARELKLLRELAPEVPILVVGLSDMSRKVGDHYESYPNIEKIRDAQRNAALQSGCAFWDLYEVMGGQNSMAAWVAHDPPLAKKDYTHFNQKGSEIVGQKLYQAIQDVRTSHYAYHAE